MKKTIALPLLQQDLRVIKIESVEEIAKDLEHIFDANEAVKEAVKLSSMTVAYRRWITRHGVKNLLVLNKDASLGEIMGVLVGAAHDILEYKEVDSVEMQSLLVQHIVENLEL